MKGESAVFEVYAQL